MEEEKVLKTNTFQRKIKRVFAGWDEKGRMGAGLILISPSYLST